MKKFVAGVAVTIIAEVTIAITIIANKMKEGVDE